MLKVLLIAWAMGLSLQAQGLPEEKPVGIQLSNCEGVIPEDAGRSFGGQMFFMLHGDLYQSDSPLLKFKVTKAPLPNFFGTPVKYRNKSFYTCDPDKTTVYRWDFGTRQWLIHARPKMGFSEFEVLLDDSLLLIATFDREKSKLGSLVLWFDPSTEQSNIWLPFAENTVMPESLEEALKLGLWTSFPHEEYVVLYGPMTGKLILVDGLKGSARFLDCDWLIEPDPKNPNHSRFPTCIQFFPQGENRFEAIYRFPVADGESSVGRLEVELPTATVRTRKDPYRSLPVWTDTQGNLVDMKSLLASMESNKVVIDSTKPGPKPRVVESTKPASTLKLDP